MGKEWGHGFDPAVCEGCPNKIDGRARSQSEVVDALFRALSRVTDEVDDVDRCGLCGCPLASLSMAQSPPSECPRLDGHAEASK